MDSKQIELIKERIEESQKLIEQVKLKVILIKQGVEEIQIGYKITNNSGQKINLLSKLLYYPEGVGIEVCDSWETIRIEEKKGVLALVKGYVMVDELVSFELYPAIEELNSRMELTGSIRLKLPLSTWHPNLGSSGVGSHIEQLNLKFGILPSFCNFNKISTSTGTLLCQPIAAEVNLYQRWLSCMIPI